nr:hypothetical protein [uncultured Tolumonas sp.]
MHTTKEMSLKCLSEIRNLWCEWDPIGVMSLADWPRDEYDSYLAPTLCILESGENNEKLINYLAYVTLDHMCLSDSESALASRIEFAEKLQHWYSNNWQNTIE